MNNGQNMEYECPEDNCDVVAHDALSIGIKNGVIGFVVRSMSYLLALSPSCRGLGFDVQFSKAEHSSLDNLQLDSMGSRAVTKQSIRFFDHGDLDDVKLRER
jgi:hypothetical protein